MKELFSSLEHTDRFSSGFLIDTCFFISMLEQNKGRELAGFAEKNRVAMTSFNVAEFIFNDHKINERVRENARKLLKKKPQLMVFDIPVTPGEREGEIDFVKKIEPDLLAKVSDPSDAVLMAAAIISHSNVLTKDKHHLFTTKLENYLNRFGLKVYKELHELL